MGQVRWAGWTMAIATALVISGGQARADVDPTKPAAIVIYPDVDVDVDEGVDTAIRLTNTNRTQSIQAHCFYLDANSHCSGGTSEGDICTEDPTICGAGLCVPGWQETDFRVVLTPSQPITWKASEGLADSQLPLGTGVCQRNQFKTCAVDSDCNPFPGGKCTPSNIGTRIPPVPEDPFEGELKCIAIDENGVPTARNDLKGEALLETVTDLPDPTDRDFDVASYNAIGIQATGASTGSANELTLGGDNAEYNGCPNFLILDHFFDNAADPIPGSTNHITTELVLVPCSEDLLRQIPGAAVIQYLVFNEFEQRFSTSNTVRCFQEIQLCHIGGGQCARSIFNVAVAGTLTGQTRMQPLGVPPLPSGMLGIAIEHHADNTTDRTRSAAFELQMSGARDTPDTITIP